MNPWTRAVTALTLLLPLACSAEESGFSIGEHFREVKQASAPVDPARIEVAEVFWYGCPHCFQFEPHIERWATSKPGDVDFVRLPTSLGRKAGEMHTRAFFTAQLLGIVERIHRPLFGKIHGQKRMMATEPELKQLFIESGGVGAEDFDGAFSGFAVDAQMRRAQQQIREWGITSVPTVVVGGKYYTFGSIAAGFENMLRVIDFLVEKVRRERADG